MKKHKNFSEKISSEIQGMITFPKGSKEEKMLMERTMASLTGDRLPNDHLPIGKVSSKRSYLKNIFTDYFEIKEAFGRIELSKIFISKRSSVKKMTQLDYIRYHYESYLNSLYILNLRINHLLDFIVSKCQKNNLTDDIKKVRQIKSLLNSGMQGIIKIRGSHVHVRIHKDSKMDHISTLEIFGEKFDFIKIYRDSEFKKIKKKITKEITGNLEVLQEFFEVSLYKEIGDLIFIKLLPNK